MLLYLIFATAKFKIKLLSHFFPNCHGCFFKGLKMDIFGLLQQFILRYKKIMLFTDIDVYKSLIWLPKLRVPQIEKTMSKSL